MPVSSTTRIGASVYRLPDVYHLDRRAFDLTDYFWVWESTISKATDRKMGQALRYGARGVHLTSALLRHVPWMAATG